MKTLQKIITIAVALAFVFAAGPAMAKCSSS